MPSNETGTSSTCGYLVVSNVLRWRNPSRRGLSLLRPVSSTMIFELSRTIFPSESTRKWPLTSFVTPTASFGRSNPASCSRTRYRASLPVAATV